MKRLLVAVIAVACCTIVDTATGVGAGRSSSVPTTAAHPDRNVQQTLAALAKLRQYGYTWTTDAGALKAIRHWQKANGLTVDGIVGAHTLASLDLTSGETQPVRPSVSDTTPTPAAPPTDIETMIREMWPDDSENWAVRIAERESNFVPTARNSCCWGLFQIHWRAHRRWLADYGVTRPEQLLDPQTNITVALALYQQTGPGPWNL